MNRVTEFIKAARSWLSSKEPLIFVVGNESCDLDSAFSAICLAYFYANATQLPSEIDKCKHRRFVPLMNISRADLMLKTEVIHLLSKNNIDAADLVCR